MPRPRRSEKASITARWSKGYFDQAPLGAAKASPARQGWERSKQNLQHRRCATI